MHQWNGINRALLGKYNDIIGSTTLMNFAKRSVTLWRLGFVKVAYLFPPETTSISPKKTHSDTTEQFLIFTSTHPGKLWRNLSAYFISTSITITILTMQKMKNSDTCMIKDSVLHTAEVNKVNWSELNWNINSVSAASCFQTVGFLFMQGDL